jgi:hypothetical protein
MRSLALLVLVLFAQVPQAPPAVPDDFALRFEFGCGDRDTIDTFAGTYSRTYRSQSTRIHVSPELKRKLFAAVEEAQFFGLPAYLSWALCEPSELRSLDVRANGATHSTSWSSCFPRDQPDTVKRLIRLQLSIIAAFGNQPGVRRLRSTQSACL